MRNRKLAKAAKERGFETVADMVAALVSEEGSVLGAAQKIGVAPNALFVWMTLNGYEVVKIITARLVQRGAA